MAGRVELLFARLRAYALARLPWLGDVRVMPCAECDRHHKRKWRQFAHTLHRKGVVCFARAADEEMTDLEILGMSAHELGHLIGETLGLPKHMATTGAGRTPLSVQDEADKAVLQTLGLVIRYNDRTLQELVDPPAELLAGAPARRRR